MIKEAMANGKYTGSLGIVLRWIRSEGFLNKIVYFAKAKPPSFSRSLCNCVHESHLASFNKNTEVSCNLSQRDKPDFFFLCQ